MSFKKGSSRLFVINPWIKGKFDAILLRLLTTEMITGISQSISLRFLFLLPACIAAQRIAVIGGGISGTFVARYLTEYDFGCQMELALYDPSPIGEYTTTTSNDGANGQGNRVATLKLEDGRLIELGASIVSEKFRFIREMAIAGNLSMVPPFETGLDEPGLNSGFLLYDGNKSSGFTTANLTASERKFAIGLRYNLEAYVIKRAMNDAISRFDNVQTFLADDTTVFSSPEEMWKAVGLETLIRTSLDELCKNMWFLEKIAWWRQFLYKQGSLQEELLSAINLVNYNQDNRAINALAGLASFSVVSVPSHGVEGGNVRLVSTAWEQAKQIHRTKCSGVHETTKHFQQRVSTVVGSLNGFELFDNAGALLGQYDLVVLAVPLPMCRIDFFIQSHIDSSVLQPMPIGELIENEENSILPDDHEGHAPLPRRLPETVSRSYTPVVTTIVKHGTLQTEYFSISNDQVPKAIYMTAHGKATTYNVTAISQISATEGIYKIFSSQPLSLETLQLFLGSEVQKVYEKMWGGPHGGATPDYRGNGESTSFLLYDGAVGFHGHTKAGALYYTNALEHALACVETSAMGAKAVAQLIAKRLEWIPSLKEDYGFGDEL